MKQLCICTKAQWDEHGKHLGGAAHYVDLENGHYAVIINAERVKVPDVFEQLPELTPTAGQISQAHAKKLGMPPTHGPWDVLRELRNRHPLFRP